MQPRQEIGARPLLVTLVLLLSLWLPLFSVSHGQSDEPDYNECCECLKWRAEIHEAEARPYVWGDYDCSKFIYMLFRDCTEYCGVPIQRCTSYDYAMGRCGLGGELVEKLKRAGCDLAFWTWPGSVRTFGHVGIFKDRDAVWHNSGSKKRVILAPVEKGGYLLKHLKRIRRTQNEN